jgi:hypothetical protein
LPICIKKPTEVSNPGSIKGKYINKHQQNAIKHPNDRFKPKIKLTNKRVLHLSPTKTCKKIKQNTF